MHVYFAKLIAPQKRENYMHAKLTSFTVFSIIRKDIDILFKASDPRWPPERIVYTKPKNYVITFVLD